MPSVYDDEKTRVDDLNRLTGISPAEEKAMEQRAFKGQFSDLASRERAAAAQREEDPSSANEFPLDKHGGDRKLGDASAAAGERLTNADLDRDGSPKGVRNKLSGQEKSKLWNPTEDDGKGKGLLKGKSRIKSWVKRRMMVLLVGLLVGGGMGSAAFGGLLGPLGVLAIGSRLAEIDLGRKGDGFHVPILRIMHSTRAIGNGRPQNGNVGVMSKVMADAGERAMNRLGIVSGYGTEGAFRGYIVDGKSLKGGIFDLMKESDRNNPQKVSEFFKTHFGWNSTIADDGKLLISSTQEGFNFKSLKLFGDEVFRAAQVKSVFKSMIARATYKRYGVQGKLHPIVAAKRQEALFRENAKAAIKRKKEAFNQSLKDVANRLSGPVQATTEVRPPPQGEQANPNTGETKTRIDSVLGDAKEAHDNPTKERTLRERIAGIAATPFALLFVADFMCIGLLIADTVDKISYENVEVPSAAVFTEQTSTADQIKAGSAKTPVKNDLDGQTDEVGFVSEKYTNKETNQSATTAEYWNNAHGRDAGVPIQQSMKAGPQDNFFTRLFSVAGMREAFQPICQITGSALFSIVLIGGSLALGAGATTVAGGVLKGIAIIELAKLFAQTLAGALIDTDSLVGPDYLNVGVQGGFLMARDMGVSMGGRVLSDEESAELWTMQQNIERDEFQRQSLAYRVFDATDPRSMMSQVMQTQVADPKGNFVNYASGLLGIGRTFGTLLAQPFRAATAGAVEPIPRDMGVRDAGFSVQELGDLRYADSPTTQSRATALLDGEGGPDLVKRAKGCFGRDILKRPSADPVRFPGSFWGVGPPQTDSIPYETTLVTGYKPAFENDSFFYNCRDTNPDWMTIRFFVLENAGGSAATCYWAASNNPVTKQACLDSGAVFSANAGASAGVSLSEGPTCNNGKARDQNQGKPAGYTVLSHCEDFEGTGLTNGWGPYTDFGNGNTTIVGDEPGQNGGRKPEQCKVANGIFTLEQNGEGATCGSSSSHEQRYGFWEVRMRAEATGGGGSKTHPVLILWPESGEWADGELDYFESDIRAEAGVFLHCTDGNPQNNCVTQELKDPATGQPVDYSEWHVYGFEWSPTGFTGYVDGKVAWSTQGHGGAQPRTAVHQTIQLDNLSGSLPVAPAKMEVDWAHTYCNPGQGQTCQEAATAVDALP